MILSFFCDIIESHFGCDFHCFLAPWPVFSDPVSRVTRLSDQCSDAVTSISRSSDQFSDAVTSVYRPRDQCDAVTSVSRLRDKCDQLTTSDVI